jgi:hypothetical protein
MRQNEWAGASKAENDSTSDYGWMCHGNCLAVIAAFIHPTPYTVDQVQNRLAATRRGDRIGQASRLLNL